MSLYDSLPKPSKLSLDRDEMGSSSSRTSTTLVSTARRTNLNANIPEYGKRKGWTPRSLTDFGDGGAFPEIWQHQFPLDMGRDEKKSSGLNSAGKPATLPIQLDSEGKIKYDVIVKQGSNKDRVVFNKLTDLLPSEILNEDDPTLAKPTIDEIDEVTAKTRAALEALTSSKISAAAPVRAAEKLEPAKYIRYTPSNQSDPGAGGSAGDPISGITGGQRIIKMIEVQKDPLEPPKFKINKKIPQAPPSPPAPVMHSPTRKVTVKEQQDWKIPPCISNWKNAKGYTIPLDKRLAADGRGLQQTHINENFAKLSEALYIADRKAREEVEMRAQMEKKIAQKEKEKKEENLRMLAKKAREERAGIRPSGLGERSPSRTRRSSDGSDSESESSEDDIEDRNEIRRERHRDRQRERNIARAAPDKRSRLERERERDISEQIALGVANPRASLNEVQFDQRLFNQSKGVGTGFGDEDNYDVYDRPWRGDAALAKNLYRPTRGKEDDAVDFEAIKSSNRFVPDKQFSGVDPSAAGSKRDGPVQFEKHVEDDPFGLDKFLTEAKKASGKRPEGGAHGSGGGADHSNRATYKKSRRD